MGRLDGRIARLELKLDTPERCETCRDWPVQHVVIEDQSSFHFDKPAAHPDVPEVCPDCGWRPQLVRIIVQDDPHQLPPW